MSKNKQQKSPTNPLQAVELFVARVMTKYQCDFEAAIHSIRDLAESLPEDNPDRLRLLKGTGKLRKRFQMLHGRDRREYVEEILNQDEVFSQLNFINKCEGATQC